MSALLFQRTLCISTNKMEEFEFRKGCYIVEPCLKLNWPGAFANDEVLFHHVLVLLLHQSEWPRAQS